MPSLERYAQSKLDDLQRRNLRRALAETLREDGIWIERDGKRLLSFSCNDYLNLTQHPEVKRAAVAALERYGAGSGASRLVTGNHPLYAELEGRMARIKGTEAAVVFGSGYLANAGIIPVLIGVPVVIGGEDETFAASRFLADHGFLAAAIRPPTVPQGTARLRLTFTAQHPDEAIDRLAALVRDKILQ